MVIPKRDQSDFLSSFSNSSVSKVKKLYSKNQQTWLIKNGLSTSSTQPETILTSDKLSSASGWIFMENSFAEINSVTSNGELLRKN